MLIQFVVTKSKPLLINLGSYMDTPELIATALWNERHNYPKLSNDEFQSREMLLQYIKLEMHAMKSFCDLSTARMWLTNMNESDDVA